MLPPAVWGMPSPDLGKRTRDLPDRGAAADSVDDQRHERGSPLRGACFAIAGCAGSQRFERGGYHLCITLCARSPRALGLLALESRIIRRWDIGCLASVAKAIHADDHRLSSLDAELKFVGAPRDLLLEEAGGDRRRGAAHLV